MLEHHQAVVVLVMMMVVVVVMMLMMMMTMTRYDYDKSIASTLSSKTHLCVCSLRLLLASVAVAHTVPVACVIECEKTWCIGARRSIIVTIMHCINDDNKKMQKRCLLFKAMGSRMRRASVSLISSISSPSC